jgi:hypothetical protein
VSASFVPVSASFVVAWTKLVTLHTKLTDAKGKLVLVSGPRTRPKRTFVLACAKLTPAGTTLLRAAGRVPISGSTLPGFPWKAEPVPANRTIVRPGDARLSSSDVHASPSDAASPLEPQGLNPSVPRTTSFERQTHTLHGDRFAGNPRRYRMAKGRCAPFARYRCTSPRIRPRAMTICWICVVPSYKRNKRTSR